MGIITLTKQPQYPVGDPSPETGADAPEVTPQMVSAGVSALNAASGSFGEDQLVVAVYSAMVAKQPERTKAPSASPK